MPVAAPPRPLLLVRAATPRAMTGELAGGRVAAFTSGCPGHDGPNEDAAAVIAVAGGLGVLAVADGVGGHPEGERASQIAVERIAGALEAHPASDDAAGPSRSPAATPSANDTLALRGAIMTGFEDANRAVIEQTDGSATTLAVVETDGLYVRPYHAGDSAILIVGQRGRIKLQSVAHSPVGYAVEAGMLDETEALSHEDRHVVSNLVGCADMRIEVGAPLQLGARDTLLIASDGLFDNLEVGEIAEVVRKGPLDDALERLAALARSRMTEPGATRPSKPDDLTMVAYRRG